MNLAANAPLSFFLAAAIVLAAGFLGPATALPQDVKVSIHPSAPPGARIRHYPSNREPLLESPLAKLPPGAVRPEGWLRRQLELMAKGMTGRLPELSQWCQIETSAWVSPRGEGTHPWEEMPYWLKGLVSLGHVVGDDAIQREAKRWLDGIIGSQEEDGFFGPRENKRKDDIWPNMVALNALQTLHEATGDPRVIQLMLRYSKWLSNLPRERLLPGSWQKIRGGDNLASVYWLYNRTGDAWLLDLAPVIHERTAPWDQAIASWHGVNITQSFREPATFYQQSKDEKHLRAAERNYDEVMTKYGQVPGGMFGADENCRPGYSGPRQGAEACSMVEYMLSFEMLLAITGSPIYADRCEEVAFNSLPASHTADLKALHYLTAPNMVQCDRENKHPAIDNSGCMFAFSPGERYRCCQHNVSHGWPYFTEHLWMAARGDGLAAVLYSPCRVEATVGDGVKVKIDEMTDYPFDEGVTLRIAAPRPVRFPLSLRIPAWAEGATVSVNGRPADVRPAPSTFAVLEREWADGDVVQLYLPMQAAVKRWPSNHGAASVRRGPLWYSLKIAERWQRSGGPDEWPELEAFAAGAWNYGLVLEDAGAAKSFLVVKKPGPLAPQPFAIEAAPIVLRAKAKRIPAWKLEGSIVAEIQDSPVRSPEPLEEVTLIPMGCARLRISAFPVVGDGPAAREWKEPPKAPRASHVHDSPFALSDGILPKSSRDQDVPRFTWWDHLGSKEWVEYELEKPRTVSRAEVYWFDDTGIGRCRVPRSWKILWKHEDEWLPVKSTSPYTVELDRFNKVTFEPVEADAVRLEVELQEGFSGGVLEWRVE